MNRYAHSVFCDDIRQEVGGKLTLVGVYSGALLVPTFPTVLPKLCIVLDIVTPADKPFQQLKVRVLRDDETLADGDVHIADLSPGNAEALDGLVADGDRLQSVMVHFVFSPLKLDKPGVVRIRVETEGEELRARGLIVGTMPAALAAQLGAPVAPVEAGK